MKYLWIMIGSGMGGVARYALSRWINLIAVATFPIGTLAVNLAGCLVIGFLTGLFENLVISPNLRVFIFVGVLGGFTTFSTFGLETFSLVKDSEFMTAGMNLLLSTIPGVFLVFVGYFFSNLLIKAFK